MPSTGSASHLTNQLVYPRSQTPAGNAPQRLCLKHPTSHLKNQPTQQTINLVIPDNVDNLALFYVLTYEILVG